VFINYLGELPHRSSCVIFYSQQHPVAVIGGAHHNWVAMINMAPHASYIFAVIVNIVQNVDTLHDYLNFSWPCLFVFNLPVSW